MKEKDLTNKIAEAGELIKGRREIIKLGLTAGLASSLAIIGETFLSPFSVSAQDKKGDVKIMNVALALEHQAIEAYTVAVGTGLLKDKTLELATHFQSQHKAHRDLLETTIKTYGGTPELKKDKYEFDTSKIKTAEDLLGFAFTLETAAASAYLGTLKSINAKDLLPIVAGIACDEAQHAAALRFAIGLQPAPEAIVK